MKKTLICFVCALLAFLFCACVAPVWYWHKDGVTQYETENAVAQCEYEKGKDHVEQGDFVTNCMKRQGFRWVQINKIKQ